MRSNMGTKFVSILLSVAIVLSMLPGRALAAEENTARAEGSVTGTLWLATAEGEQAPLPDYEVQLKSGGATVGTAYTDGSGGYAFAALADGAYTVEAAKTDAVEAPGVSGEISIAEGAAVTGVDITLVAAAAETAAAPQPDAPAETPAAAEAPAAPEGTEVPPPAETQEPPAETVYENSIGGVLWLDGDSDGLRGEAETAMPGYTVQLFKAEDRTTPVQTTQTDETGAYRFTGIVPGSYVVGISASTQGDTEYLLPIAGITAENQFEDYNEAYTTIYSKPIELGADTAAAGLNAGIRLPMEIQPAATLTWYTIPARVVTITSTSITVSGAVLVGGDKGLNFTLLVGPPGSDPISPTSPPWTLQGIASYETSVQSCTFSGVTISGLSPGTDYIYSVYYRSNYYRAATTPIAFTTPPAPPTATTNAATGITTTGATLNGTFHTQNVSGNIYYQYGTSTSYGSTASYNSAITAANSSAPKAISGLTPNTTYYYRLVATTAGGTTYGSPMSFTTLPNAPTATTNAASGITASGATLNGSFHTQGVNGNVYYQYGTTTSYGSTLSYNSAVNGANSGAAKALTGLAANTTYYYRLVTTTTGGTAYGSQMSFKTLPNAPTATTNAATDLTGTTAKLNGMFHTQGVNGNVYYQYGTTASYGSVATYNASVNGANTAAPVTLTGLTANTTYYYRLAVVTTGGTIYGSQMSFATLPTYALTYHANGGAGGPAQVTGLLAQTGYSLNSSTAPTHAQVGGTNVVFIGWTSVQDTYIYTKDDAAPATVTTVNISANTTVYAVWGYDTNRDGIADVGQSKYALTYHANGGNADGPAQETGLLPQSGYLLNLTVPTHAQVSGTDVVFIGWTTAQDSHIYAAADTAPATIVSVTISGNTTVYAAWGYDMNADGTPDVVESKFRLTYHENGGNANGPGIVNGLIAQTGYILNNTTIPTHARVSGADVVFIGWAAAPDSTIYGKDDAWPAAITSVDISGNTNVYALWGYDTNGDGIPDVQQPQYTLAYNDNGGNGDGPAQETGLLVQSGYTLSSTVPTHAQDSGKDVVFIGWTAAPDSTIYDKDNTLPVTVTTVNITGNTTVYAVWGYDTNGDGIPDVTEPKYTLDYNDNGGNGDGPAQETGLLAQSGYSLNSAVIPTHAQVGGEDVVFVGWTAAVDSNIYTANDAAPTTITTVNITGNTTVYAVWGYDVNGDGTPDVTDPKYTLDYDDNGGNGDGPAQETGLLAQTGHGLSAAFPTHVQESGKDVVFIGWTAAQDAHIYDKDDTAPTTITAVDISGNTTVYAVWGFDANGNGVADTQESQYTLDYDSNGGNGDGPAQETGLLTQMGYVLNSSTIPTHAQDSGLDVVFIGWKETQDTYLYTKDDTAPVTVTDVDISGNTTVYAVWGYDMNGDGTPDVTDPKYTLNYDVNGGNTDGPTQETNLLAQTGYALNSTVIPTHPQVGGADVVFIGWTAAQDSTIYDKDDALPTTITGVDISGNVTVYAVWGYDTNGDGTPDVQQPQYTLAYNDNGGNGDGPSQETGLLTQNNHLLSFTVPSHVQESGKDVVFIGWTAAQDAYIYGANDLAPTTITTVNITGNTTVYAVWGYDVNGDGTPDVTDPKYTLDYDANGGNADGPAQETGLLAQTGYTLNSTVIPTHAQDSGKDVVFIGWTAAQDTNIYAANDVAPTTITAVNITGNNTVYAVWGYDVNGDGMPDVAEPKYTLDYDGNGGNADGPAQETGLLAQSGYTLNSTVIPTHAQDSGKDVVFIGWTAAQDNTIYTANDVAPTTITAVSITGNTTVYAVWGYDVNGDGTPDVTDPKYTLDYDGNGGNADGPAQETGLLAQSGYTLNSTVIPTHAQDSGKDVVFIGWTAAQDAHIYTANDAAPTTITTVNITGNTTVYAVWGYDLNGDGTPDVTDPKYMLDYDDNGGNADGPAQETGLLAQSGYTLNSTVIPTHAQDSGKDVVFIGWTAAADSQIYAAADTAPATIAAVNITGNTTVYAVWGYDVNGDGIPDVVENKYSLTYHENGGNADGPGIINGLIAQSGYSLSGIVPTHTQDSGKDVVFIGWTAVQDSTIYAANDVAPTTMTTVNITGNTTVYAVWGYDVNGDGTPDVTDPKYTLNYNDNGGNADGPAQETGLLAQSGYALNSTVIPTHAQVSGKDVVFIGWTAVLDSTIYAANDVAPTTIITVNITGNTTVYAVWGYDVNGDGMPDVTETKYTLDYDGNGGNADGPAQETGLLAQSGYALNSTVIPTHAQDSGKDVVFIGWTAAQDTNIYAAIDAAPTTITVISITGNTTVYAVWGYDTNGDGSPDVTDPKYTLDYDGNGGNTDGPAQETGLLAQSGYTLNSTVIPTHAQDSGKDVVFIGWTAAQDSIIYTANDVAPTTITTVNITGNTTVYAVWGYDVNGDGMPDVTEPKYTLDYDANGGNANGPAQETGLLAQSGYTLNGTVIPTHAQDSGKDVVFIGWTAAPDSMIYTANDAAPATIISINITGNTTVYAVWGYDTNGDGTPDVTDPKYTLDYDVNGGNADGPAQETGLLAQNNHMLSFAVPTHAQDSGKDVVFIGWTAAQDAHIYGANDLVPATITTVNITGNTTVYAVWGYDVNGDGTPDVTDPKYTLDYNDNGGNADGPAQETGLLAQSGYALNSTVIPTHAQVSGADVVFIGWTAAPDSMIYVANDVAPTTVTTVNITGNTTVYAVWGYDLNGDGTPDVTDPKYTLDYDANGGNGDGPVQETGLLAQSGYTLNSTVIPTHAQDSGKDVVFIGWTAAQDSTIYTANDVAPTTVTTVNITSNTAVYAVWGYDVNGDGTPDVTDPKYTLDYNDNGGNADGPAQETGLLAQSGYTLNSAVIPTHAQDSGEDVVFIGWTAAQDAHIYGANDVAPTTITAVNITGNTTVYAVWGYDVNGDGTPDVTDPKYTLDYHDNGGNGDGPVQETGLLAQSGYTLDSGTIPTHAQDSGKDVVFIGWTAAPDNTIYTANAVAPITITTVNITGNTTVYAVWGYDVNGDGIPDVVENKYSLTYHENGGNADGPGVINGLIAQSGYSLSGTVPTHAQDSGKDVVFIGWTAAQDSIIYTASDVAPTTITTVNITGNTTVYAVWGYDTNGDGTPDVTDPKYTLDYDDNGGNADGPAQETGLLAQTGYVLNSTVIPTHAQVSGADVVFIGWTAAPDSVIYTANDAAPAAITAVTIAGNTTVYAVWGYDTNGDGTPDVTDPKYTLDYDDNGGDANGPAQETGLLAQSGYTLNSTVIPTHAQDSGTDVLFIGWTAAQDSHIYTAADMAPSTIASVNISGNTTVYAVWGYDTNGDGMPDVGETKYTLDYHENGGHANGPGSVTHLIAQTGYTLNSTVIPTHAQDSGKDVVFIGWTAAQDAHIYDKNDTVPATVTGINITGNTVVYAVWGYDTNGDGIADVGQSQYHLTYDENGGNPDGPPQETGLLTQNGYALNSTIVPTHAQDSGIDVLFAGWTAVQDSHIYNAADILPATIVSVNISGNTTVYAVWGYDTNGDGIPDVQENKFTLTYHTNGGHAGGPGIVNGLIAQNGYILNYSTIPTHAQDSGKEIVFIGWTAAQDAHIYEKDDAVPSTVTSVNITGNTTVYAVWGYDSNGDGIADVGQSQYTLTYDVNGGNADGPAQATGLLAQNGYRLSTATPTHVQMNGQNVSFLGWSQTQNPGIFAYTDTLPAVIAAVNIAGNTTVYAVWGFERPQHSIQVNYVDRAGHSLLASNSFAVSEGTTFWANAASIADYVFVDWYEGSVGTGALNGNRTPGIPSVRASGQITLVYGQDMTQDGIEDFTITEETYGPEGPLQRTRSMYANQVFINIGGAYDSVPQTFDGYTYRGYQIDGGTEISGNPHIASITAEHTVRMLYVANSPNVDDTNTDDAAAKHNYEFVKKPNVTNVQAGQTVDYTFSGFGNHWGVSIQRYTIMDKPNKGLDFVSAQLPAFTMGTGVTYSVYYFTKLGGTTQYTLATEVSAGQPYSITAPKLADGDYITLVSIEFGEVPAGFGEGDTIQMTFRVWENPPQKSLVNVGILSYSVNGVSKEFTSGGGENSVIINGWFTAVQTGDDRNLALEYILLSFSLFGLAALFLVRRKSSRETH